MRHLVHVQKAPGVAILLPKAQALLHAQNQQPRQPQGAAPAKPPDGAAALALLLARAATGGVLPGVPPPASAPPDMLNLMQTLSGLPPLGLAQPGGPTAVKGEVSAESLQAFLRLSGLTGTAHQPGNLPLALPQQQQPQQPQQQQQQQQQQPWLAAGGLGEAKQLLGAACSGTAAPSPADMCLRHLLDAISAMPSAPALPQPRSQHGQEPEQPQPQALPRPRQHLAPLPPAGLGALGSQPASVTEDAAPPSDAGHPLPRHVESLLLDFIQAAVPDSAQQARGVELTFVIKMALQQ